MASAGKNGCTAGRSNGKRCNGLGVEEGLCAYHRRKAEGDDWTLKNPPADPFGHKKRAAQVTPEPPPTAGDTTQPPKEVTPSLRIFEGQKATRVRGHRRIKMLRPLCNPAKMRALGLPEGDACQDKANYKPRWWDSCPHEPYYSLAERRENKPILEAVLDAEGKETGRLRKMGETEEFWYVETPNLVQVTATVRHNWALGFQRALAKGYMLPETHPTKPLAPYCQYANCWAQNPAHRNGEFGDYCEEWQLREVGADTLGVTLEVGADNLPGSVEKRRKQLQEINV